MKKKEQARPKLSNADVGRIYFKLQEECASTEYYTEVHYSTLAWRVSLPWRFAWHDNAMTITALREALERLERLRLISVKPLDHNNVLVRLCPRSLQLKAAKVKNIRKLLELEATNRTGARRAAGSVRKRVNYGHRAY
ncbi:hypothetical protein PG1550B_0066 [Bifidobacterium pseudolongum subsp. globosum]|uniref:hypothetical protein n=1 Tax=Bifidobacterium pseudolongum TaxID=1694 RepID=UPI0010209DED|nr:hypothetical protein [Bifidobacterium pseudolongum]RYQ58998.1 hypothetical protein PG1550B_0066 [Bifidobacterium pseudolongum subsp. globosum]